MRMPLAWTRKKPTGPVIDLDELVEEGVSFQLLGKTRELVPLSLETFLAVQNKMAALAILVNGPSANPSTVADAYHAVFAAVVRPIAREEVSQMTSVQAATLLSLITRRIQGESEESLKRIEEEASKKKT